MNLCVSLGKAYLFLRSRVLILANSGRELVFVG